MISNKRRFAFEENITSKLSNSAFDHPQTKWWALISNSQEHVRFSIGFELVIIRINHRKNGLTIRYLYYKINHTYLDVYESTYAPLSILHRVIIIQITVTSQFSVYIQSTDKKKAIFLILPARLPRIKFYFIFVQSWKWVYRFVKISSHYRPMSCI